MCGISGIVHRDPGKPIDQARLIEMREILAHRGPDDAGCLIGPGVGLAARRLAVIDLSDRGHQPMVSPDGRYSIVYNGEVYNFRDLRRELEGRGQTFRSETDTEVVLRLYIEEGPPMLDRLNGMFAFAIWDAHERTLFLARDRVGIKPLCYTHSNDVLAFASEEKALFAGGAAEPQFDPATWEELLCFRYVAGERTPFTGVRRLLPGHYLLWRDGGAVVRRWWHLGERVRELRDRPVPEARSWFQETFESAVAQRLMADVPVGVLLSGGLDSGCLAAALAAAQAERIASFTVRFDERRYDEGPLARQVADRFGLEYHELAVSPRNLARDLLRTCWLNDEPPAHASDLHLREISRYARPRVTVLLSGEGADETLGGYVRYRPLRHPTLLGAVRPALGPLITGTHLDGRLGKLARLLALGRLERFVLFNACEVFPGDLESLGAPPDGRFPYREQVLAEAAALYPGEPLRQAMYSDQHTFLCSLLDRNDRMTMGASIECRVPFLDPRLVEGLAALPSSVLLAGLRSKNLLRNSVGAHLPEEIRRGRKWGFGVPWNRYLREIPELREQMVDLHAAEPIGDGPFERARVKAVVARFLAGDDRFGELARQLLMIACWHRACVAEWGARRAGRRTVHEFPGSTPVPPPAGDGEVGRR